MALVKKRTGAPAGTIKFSFGNRTYLFDDGVNAQVDVPVPGDYYELIQHPYLDAVGGSSTFTPPPVIEQVYVVDGTLSKRTGDNTYSALSVGGGTVPFSVVSAGASAATIQAALNTARHVYLSTGNYTLNATLTGGLAGQTLECAPGVTIQAVAGCGARMIDITDKDDWTFKGNDATFDLNNISDTSIRIRGSAGIIKNPKMERFRTINRSVPTNFVGATYIAKADRAMMYKVRVENYGSGMTGSANVAYAFYFEDCTRSKMYQTDAENCRVGVEFWNCFDCKAQSGYMKTLTDNGIYCTGTTGGRNVFVHMTIDACEEGIAVNNDDVTIDTCTLINNTNTGITMRGRRGTKVLHSRFDNNSRHIGDDNGLANSTANSGYLIKGNHFYDVSAAGNEMMQLRWFKRGRITDNFFRKTTGTSAMILVAGNATDGSGDYNTIDGNEFDDVNKTITGQGCIRLSVGSGLVNYTRIAENRFMNGTTAINLFSAAGTPGVGTVIDSNYYGAGITNTISASSNAIKYSNTPVRVNMDGVSGLAAWYAAEQITGLADAAAVPQWNDLSGNNRHLLQATGTAQPTYRERSATGFPGIRFDGTDDNMTVATFSLAQPMETFVVFKQTATGNRTLIDGLTADSASIKRGGTTVFNASAGTNSPNVAVTAVPDKMRLAHASYGSGVASFLKMDNVGGTLADIGTAAPGGLTVGSAGGGTSFFPGDISEIVVYNRQLTSGEREAIRYALAQKYRERWI